MFGWIYFGRLKPTDSLIFSVEAERTTCESSSSSSTLALIDSAEKVPRQVEGTNPSLPLHLRHPSPSHPQHAVLVGEERGGGANKRTCWGGLDGRRQGGEGERGGK
jgi:hypothetical protein